MFNSNNGFDGGALALFGRMIFMPQTVVFFIGNHAVHAGGAVMVYDESLLFIDYCFYHIELIEGNQQTIDTRIILENNS